MNPTWTRSDDEVLATLQDVVSLESVNPGLPGGQRGEIAMVEYIESFFAELDIPTQRQEVLPGRPNILATLEGQQADRVLLFECHMDTASAEVMTIPPFEPHIRDGLLYGRGSCDTKAGGVSMIHAMKRLRQAGIQPACTVAYAGVVDEEHLFRGSRHLAEQLQPAAAVISEPTDLEVVRAHKGVVRFHIAVAGRAAHSAKPHLGSNAIVAMAGLIHRLEDSLGPAYAAQNDPLLGHPTYNIGVIEGGAQVNFVPDSCRITIDCRILPGTTPDETMDAFRQIVAEAQAADPDLQAEVEEAYFRCAPLGTEESAAIVQQAAAGSRQVLGRDAITGVPYATDGSPFSERGVPAIVLGPGSIDQAHGAVEWVDCQQVLQAVDIYQYIMEKGV